MSSSSRKLLILVALVAACFVCSQARTVTVLTNENYDSLVSEGKWLVDLYVALFRTVDLMIFLFPS